MDRKLAEQIVHAIVSLNKEIGEIDAAISKISDETEKRHYIVATGSVLRSFNEDFLKIILEQYPDLNPYES